MDSLSNKIRQYRKKKGLTQEKLAKKLFVSRKTISSWENGRSFPDFRTIIRLSEIFDIKVDDLLRGDNKVIKHFEEQDKQLRRDNQVEKVSYYINILFLILCYVHMFKLFGFHTILIPVILVGNMIIFLSHYTNWNSFKEHSKLTWFILSFVILLVVNIFTLPINLNFQKALPRDTIGIIAASAAEFTLILLINVSLSLAIFFRPAKEKKQHKNK